MRNLRMVREMRRRGVSVDFMREALRLAKQMEEDVATSLPDHTSAIAARIAYQAKSMILDGERLEMSLIIPVLRAFVTLSVHFLCSSLMEGGHWLYDHSPSSFFHKEDLPPPGD